MEAFTNEPSLDEQVHRVSTDLTREFAGVVSEPAVEAAVWESFHAFTHSPIRTFVPILAQRNARERLRRLFSKSA